jgi:hypothetical protein
MTMPDIKEKLVELINDVLRYQPWGEIHSYTANYIANELIANGVTIQEWISVEERLPEESGLYLTAKKTSPTRWLERFDKDVGEFGAWWHYEPDGTKHQRYRFIREDNVTHWMPLPEPPAEEVHHE